jgi:hypothetical protein
MSFESHAFYLEHLEDRLAKATGATRTALEAAMPRARESVVFAARVIVTADDELGELAAASAAAPPRMPPLPATVKPRERGSDGVAALSPRERARCERLGLDVEKYAAEKAKAQEEPQA